MGLQFYQQHFCISYDLQTETEKCSLCASWEESWMCTHLYSHFLQFLQYHCSLEFQMLSSICSQELWYHCLHSPLRSVSYLCGYLAFDNGKELVSTLTGWRVCRYACLRRNEWICPFLMHWRRCYCVWPGSDLHAVRSVLQLSTVAKARAHNL